MRDIKRDEFGRFIKGHQETRGENNPNWKGDEAGYFAIHDWVKLRLGKPRLCSECGTTEAKKYEWANISGQCKRELTDWRRLCVSCHRKWDGHAYTMWQTRRSNA